MTINNGKLIVHAINGPTFELFAEKENLFFFAQDDQAEIDLVSDDKGMDSELILYQND